MPIRYPLAQATRMILGDDHGLRDPRRWVMVRLRDGRFRGTKIRGQWYMRPVDVQAAEDAMYATPVRSQPESQSESQPFTVIGGLSARATRRLAKGA